MSALLENSSFVDKRWVPARLEPIRGQWAARSLDSPPGARRRALRGTVVTSVSPGGPGTVVTGMVQMAPEPRRNEEIQVKAATLIPPTMDMQLLTLNWQVLPSGQATMSVQPALFATFALVILASALGVFVMTSAGHAIRRRVDDAPTAWEHPVTLSFVRLPSAGFAATSVRLG
jgi:hypothetical protein